MSSLLTPGQLLEGRIRVDRILKETHGVCTVLGSIVGRPITVILKATDRSLVSTSAQLRLTHEAHVLCTLKNPYLAPLLSVGTDANTFYLVMAHVAGETLFARLAKGALTVTETLSLAQCLLSALDHAHSHGVLHRDIKPSNVVVSDRDGALHATLIDFGLSRSSHLDANLRDQHVGTLRYISPEQAGLIRHDVGEPADLYSLGVMLYECLAGHSPFQSESVGQLLREHLTQKAAPLRTLGLQLPRALDELIQRLLEKDPRERYQSARAVAEDVAEIAQALKAGIKEPAVVVGARDRREALAVPAFVGRSQELALLMGSAAEARRGEGGLSIVEAPSGTGKSRLLDELAQECASEGFWVLRGQAATQAGQRVLEVFSSIANEIALEAVRQPALKTRILEALGDTQASAVRAFPQLANLLGMKPSPDEASLTHMRGDELVVDALCRILGALGTAECPVMVLIDDVQWADELSIKLFAEWNYRTESSREPRVGIVVATRSDELDDSHPLRRATSAFRLSLGPLTGGDVKSFIESMLGAAPVQVLETVERISLGNPFMAEAVLRGMVETGVLSRGAEGWQVDEAQLAQVVSSRQAIPFLERRLSLLPKEAREFLSAAAILGKEFEWDIARRLVNQSPEVALQALAQARQRCLLWSNSTGSVCTFAHDKLRETVLASLGPARRAELHLLAATDLERNHPERHFDLAYHFDAAQVSLRALPHALKAAAAARKDWALEIAERHYRIALRALNQLHVDRRFEVIEGLGDVLMQRGRYAEAAEQFERAQTYARTPVAEAELLCKIGELALKRDDVQGARTALELALTRIGCPVPKSRFALRFLTFLEIVAQVLHVVFPKLFVGRRQIEDGAHDLLCARLYNRLSYPLWYLGEEEPLRYCHLRNLNLSQRYPPTRELGQAYSNHAVAMTAAANHRLAIAYAERGLKVRQAIQDRWGEAQAHSFYGLALMNASRHEEAIEHYEQAGVLLERTGDRWELLSSKTGLAHALLRAGKLRRMVQVAESMRRSAEYLGAHQPLALVLEPWSKATGGQIPKEVLEKELQITRQDDRAVRQALAQAEGSVSYYAGRFQHALECFEQAQRIVQTMRLRDFTAPIPIWMAACHRRMATQAPQWSSERRKHLEFAEHHLQQGLRFARLFPNHLPFALRERGRLDALQGNLEEAKVHFDESLAMAEKTHAEFERAMTLTVRGEVGLVEGWSFAQKDHDEGLRALADIGAEFALEGSTSGTEERNTVTTDVPTLSLAHRFSSILQAGRSIAGALEKDAVYLAVRDAALDLLRGERCLVLERDKDGNRVAASDVSSDHDYSHTLVERAYRLKKPALLEDSVNDSSESVILSGVRSALCAPIFMRGEVVGCFYLTHGKVGGLFGPDESRLAEYIATLAGIALENSEGFRQVQMLTKSLEERVEQRTLALTQANSELNATMDRLRESQAKLVRLANTDELTQVHTRRYLQDELARICRDLVPKGGVVTAIMLDVDYFKKINDTLGHATGDIVLRQVADIIRRCIRGNDHVARFGGEEFVVILPNTSPEGGLVVAEKIRAAVEAEPGPASPVTVSLGVATLHVTASQVEVASTGHISDKLLRQADAALYRAKRGGRNRVETHTHETPSMVM